MVWLKYSCLFLKACNEPYPVKSLLSSPHTGFLSWPIASSTSTWLFLFTVLIIIFPNPNPPTLRRTRETRGSIANTFTHLSALLNRSRPSLSTDILQSTHLAKPSCNNSSEMLPAYCLIKINEKQVKKKKKKKQSTCAVLPPKYSI